MRYNAKLSDAGLIGQSVWYSEIGNIKISGLTMQGSDDVYLLNQKRPVYTYDILGWLHVV